MSQPAAKRLKKLEKRVNNIYRSVDTKPNRSVLDQTGTVNNGTVAVVRITGNYLADIKVLSVQVRGNLGNEAIDLYLVQSNTSTAPVYADFQALTGGFLADGKNDQFHIWKHYNPTGGSTNARIIQRWSKGFICPQDLSGDSTGKGLYLVIKNNTGSNHAVSLCIETYSIPFDN